RSARGLSLCQPVHISLIANSPIPVPEARPFMPRDNDKDNASSRGRRDRPSGGKGRSGAARGPDKKFAKRGFAGKSEGEKRPYAGKSDGARSYGKKPYSGSGKPYAGKREGRSDDRGGEKRPYTPRSDRPNFTPRG